MELVQRLPRVRCEPVWAQWPGGAPRVSSTDVSLSPPPGTPLPPPPPPAQACYRHPDRLTGRSCTRCGRPTCADCLTPASVGSLCPECVRSGRAPLAQRVRFWGAGQFDAVTKSIVGVNVAVFAAAAIWGGGDPFGRNRFHLYGALVGPSVQESAGGPVYRGVAEGAWWRLVTSGFLHYGPIHLLLNMYVLWIIGPALERELGRSRYLLVYMASLLGGAAGAMILSPGNLTAGASGAIFGIFGAFATGLWKRGINPFRTSIGTTLLINLGLTFVIGGTTGGISIGGHLGGLVAGAICGWFLLGHPARRQPSWTYLVPVAVGVVAVLVTLQAAGRA